MVELVNSKLIDKRVVFPRGKQAEFLLRARKKLNLSWPFFAKKFRIHRRTLNDWRREQYSIPFGILKRISDKARIKIPSDIEIKDRFWYVHKGARAAWLTIKEKYGRVPVDEDYRKKCWREWWKKEGQYRQDLLTAIVKPIRRPLLSSSLSEFVGIILGDGGITSTQVTVTLNMYDDKEYGKYVINLFKILFGVNPSEYERRESSIFNIVVSRTELVRFLTEKGLSVGGKVRQQVGIPDWIKASDSYSKTCLRGLFDTDGCFYMDRHKYKNKTYFNAGMNFTNHSLPILHFFKECLEKYGFHPTQKTEFSIFLRKKEEIIRYFKEIGSSNQKHFRKFKHYLELTKGGVG